jgi:glucosyl-3-phosphoglycerate synthase
MRYFSYKDFNLDQLIKLKKKRSLTVGVALPVFNEEDTLSKTLDAVNFCGELVDELIVIDSGSSDNSIQILKKKKIRFVNDTQTAKDLSVRLSSGKGWNLWSSIYYLNTDLILWIDTDIENIDPRFIIGLAGPLISDRSINFVKGYYHRPKGDARVTEIMARPFLNFCFPKTIEFIQPLSGEYGGRRKFLESIQFYSGYSVESAVLIQASYKLKSNQIAQTYLDTRIHKLQEIQSLGLMSSQILQTLFHLANDMGVLKIQKKLYDKLVQYKSLDGSNFHKNTVKIKERILPAMINIPAYVEKYRFFQNK